MMLYKYNEIKTVHLEITDNCNAACPMCARNINGGQENPQIPGTELFIEDIRRILLLETPLKPLHILENTILK